MIDRRDLPQLKGLGSGRQRRSQILRDFGAEALWSRRASAKPTITHALVIAESLRREGDLRSRTLALKIEQACRAALQHSE